MQEITDIVRKTKILKELIDEHGEYDGIDETNVSILESEEGIVLSVTLKMVWFPKDEENNNKGKK